MKELSFPSTEHEDGDEGEQHDEDREENRPPHGTTWRDDQLADVARHWPVAEMLLEMVCRVVDHHDRLIHQDADGNGDSRQRHDVGLDVDDVQHAQHPHQQKRKQDSQRQRDADHKDAADVHQDEQDGQRGNEHLMPHHFRQRVNRSMNQPRPVVGGNNMDPLGKSRLKLLDLFFHTLRDLERVFSMPHEHYAAGYFVAVFFVNAAAELRTELHAGHVLDVDRRPSNFGNDGVFNILLALNPADAADDELRIVLLDDATAGRHVAA